MMSAELVLVGVNVMVMFLVVPASTVVWSVHCEYVCVVCVCMW